VTRRWLGARPATAVVVGVASGLAGVVVGAAVMARVQDAGSRPALPPTATSYLGVPTSSDDPAGSTGGDDPAGSPGSTAGGAIASAPPAPEILLAWTPDGLDPGLVAAAAADSAVGATSVVRGGVLDMVRSRDAGGAAVDAPAPGWALPLDAVAIDPARHAPFVSTADEAAVAGLADGEALLGTTSAELRRLGPGAVVQFAGGGSVVVAGVVSDPAIGGAELAVTSTTGAQLGLGTDRYLLAIYDGERPPLERRLRAALTSDAAVRFRGPGETPVLRHGDAVLPQARIKQRFGEFAYRPGPGDTFEQDPAWQEAHLVTVDLPIIGTARCHRGIVDALAGALAEIIATNLASLIDPEGFAGCWNPRTTRSGTSLSRHAWGVAADLNFPQNRTGLDSVQDPRLLAVFDRWGFTDGSSWLVPDAGHFEYVSPPRG
jgi:hypothetical protein